MEAERYKQVDKDYRQHLQAYLNFVVQAKKQSGKKERPVYNTFEKFYNYKEELQKISNKGVEKSRFAGLSKFFKEKKGE